jgi:Predicted glycosyltransferases
MENIAIIILNWNNKVLTEICINSVKSQIYKDYKIFVVDNNSSDGSISYLKRKFNDIEVIQNKSNLGYAAGNNVGIIKAIESKYQYIFILNNDIELLPSSLKLLVDLLNSNRNIGVVAPIALIYNNDKRYAKVDLLYGAYNFLLGKLISYKIDKSKPTEVKLAEGCALMFKSEVFKKSGLFDEKYYMYWEEYDLLTRVSNCGYSIFVHPLARIYHREGSSSGFSKFPKNYYMLRNQLLFHKKYSPSTIYVCFLIYFIFKLPFFLFRKKNIRNLRLNLAGIKDFLNNRYYISDIIRNTKGFFK